MHRKRNAKMRKSNELINELEHGDYERIADITGFSKVYVSQVIHETRNNETILKAANEYIDARNRLKKKFCREVSIDIVTPTPINNN